MIIQIEAELVYFGWSMGAGALAAVIGLLVIWLHQGRRRSVWLGILDLSYWFSMSTLFFFLCYYRNSGELRGYAMAGSLSGYLAVRLAWRRIKKELQEKHKKVKM